MKWGAASGSRERRPENVAGDFYVDHTCIDCDTCRFMAPATFGRAGDQSAVLHQPTDKEARVAALQALLSCPTYSIHTNNRAADELKEAQQGLPQLIPGTTSVYYCGWADAKSYACQSYLIVRPEGNVLVDSPRFNPVLAQRIKEMGGVNWMFLTHKDDVGDHAKWAKHFNATRILHETEVVPDTAEVEHKLTGSGPWSLPDGSKDIELVFTPGHTSGHVCLYYAPDHVMCTGDHLSADYVDPEALYIFTDFNWYSVPLQVESVAKLLQYDFLHALPGHGRRLHLRDAAHRLKAVSELVEKHSGSSGKERQGNDAAWQQEAMAAARAVKAS